MRGTETSTLPAPPALHYNRKIDSIRIHLWLSIVHFAGMIAFPSLGKIVSNQGNYSLTYDEALTVHRSVAITTISSMALSALIIFLPF